MDKPISTITLEFLEEFAQDKDRSKFRESLSAAVRIENNLFVASDESTSIERFTIDKLGKYHNHKSFSLEKFITLPVGAKNSEDEINEVDIEGMDIQDNYLWIVGSHSLKRKKTKENDSEAKNIKKLTKVEVDGNRYILAKIPLVKENGDYKLVTPEETNNQLYASQLEFSDKKDTNELKEALKEDPHLKRFLEFNSIKETDLDISEEELHKYPKLKKLLEDLLEQQKILEKSSGIAGKDNGLDIEGLVVHKDRVFLGLRGPVIRGWAIILEVKLVEDINNKTRLHLDKIDGKPYRKHFLQLNGLGVRDLCRDGEDLLILAGPTMDVDGQAYIYRWHNGLNQTEERLLWLGKNGELQKIMDITDNEDDGLDNPEAITINSDSRENPTLLVLYDSPKKERLPKEVHSVSADVFSLPVEKMKFTGFAVEMASDNSKNDLAKIFDEEVGKGWVFESIAGSSNTFDVTNNCAYFTPAQAWEITYKLRNKPRVVYSEPLFAIESIPETISSVDRRREFFSLASNEISFSSGLFGGEGHLPSSNNPEWSLEQVKVKEAWQEFFPNASPENPPGAGIIIGHPDTGYTNNPETIPNINVNDGFNFLEGGLAEDKLTPGLLRFPGHGTGTASVIVSPVGAQSEQTDPGISGIAPGAKIIPFRVSTSVVLLADMGNLSRAIEKAADKGAHVISISMGGLFSSRLRKAVKYAQKKGVIILAAAGNYVGFVVWPAAFDEVIAVAASNVDRRTWAFSSNGSKVDVSAPGESVWCAKTESPANYTVTRSSGTSFSVATTAGIAALWLARHGRDNLIQKYGQETLPFVFNYILRRSCDPFANNTTPSGFGAGIVNAQKVLATPLPNNFSVPVESFNDFVSLDMGGLETFSHLLSEDVNSASVTSKLSSLLGVASEEVTPTLKKFGQELAFHLASSHLLNLFNSSSTTDLVIFSAVNTIGREFDSNRTYVSTASPMARGIKIDEIRQKLLNQSVSKELKDLMKKAQEKGDR